MVNDRERTAHGAGRRGTVRVHGRLCMAAWVSCCAPHHAAWLPDPSRDALELDGRNSQLVLKPRSDTHSYPESRCPWQMSGSSASQMNWQSVVTSGPALPDPLAACLHRYHQQQHRQQRRHQQHWQQRRHQRPAWTAWQTRRGVRRRRAARVCRPSQQWMPRGQGCQSLGSRSHAGQARPACKVRDKVTGVVDL